MVLQTTSLISKCLQLGWVGQDFIRLWEQKETVTLLMIITWSSLVHVMQSPLQVCLGVPKVYQLHSHNIPIAT